MNGIFDTGALCRFPLRVPALSIPVTSPVHLGKLPAPQSCDGKTNRLYQRRFGSLEESRGPTYTAQLVPFLCASVSRIRTGHWQRTSPQYAEIRRHLGQEGVRSRVVGPCTSKYDGGSGKTARAVYMAKRGCFPVSASTSSPALASQLFPSSGTSHGNDDRSPLGHPLRSCRDLRSATNPKEKNDHSTK